MKSGSALHGGLSRKFCSSCLKIFAVSILIFLAACAGMVGLSQKPEITLTGVDLLELGLLQQRFILRLRIQNPNDADMPISGLSFALELDGKPFATGGSAQAVTVPGQGEARLDVVVSSELSHLLRQWREWEKSGQQRVGTLIHGRITLAGAGSISFERRGDLPVPRFDRSLRKPSSPARPNP
jgi:LEA14-like dessication related protein